MLSHVIDISLLAEVRGHFQTSFPPYAEIIEGDDHVFRCEVSDEDTVVFWLKNDRKLSIGNDKYIVEEDGVLRTLTLKKATPEDSGEYACETVDGRSRAEGGLVVKGKPFGVVRDL